MADEKRDDQGRILVPAETLEERHERHSKMPHEHVANEVIGLPRGPDTHHLYRIFDHFHGHVSHAAPSRPSASTTTHRR